MQKNMDSNAPYVTNLVNSIIGVSVLAMPFCMKKCGLLLGLGLLICISWLTYVSCNMLITAAVAKRRRTYEYLAFYTVGPTGKFAVELSMIGLMLGTCVAFYVIIGDLATAILQGMIQAEPQQLRAFVIVFCALCVALPLGLMKSLSVLGFLGLFSLIFYGLFVCVMIANAISSGLLTLNWLGKVELFKPSGVFQCLPIFSLAYACQCQLFVVYDSLEDATMMRMERIVSTSLKIVTFVYCMVAFLGYTMYLDSVEGNVLKNFLPNVILDLIKFGFAISVVVGFPLMIFPCRQSIHTLFFSQQPTDGVPTKTYIEPFTFKAITLFIVLLTMMVALFIPNVETILGLTGATMGSFICFIFPGIIYPKASPKGDTGISKLVFGIGCMLLILCTYSNVYSAMESSNTVVKQPQHIDPVLNDAVVPPLDIKSIENSPKENDDVANVVPSKPPVAEVVDSDHRHEPANPIEPVIVHKEESRDGEPLLSNNEKSNLGSNIAHGDTNKHIQSKESEGNGDGDIQNANNVLSQKVDEADKPVQKRVENLVPKPDPAGKEIVPEVDLAKKNEEANKNENVENSSKHAIDKVPDLPKIKAPMDSDKGVDSRNKDAPHNGVKTQEYNKPANEVLNKDKTVDEQIVKSNVEDNNLNEILDEEKLIDQIKEHHKEQSKLLDAQQKLINVLEKHHDIHKSENDLQQGKSNDIKKDLSHTVSKTTSVKSVVNEAHMEPVALKQSEVNAVRNNDIKPGSRNAFDPPEVLNNVNQVIPKQDSPEIKADKVAFQGDSHQQKIQGQQPNILNNVNEHDVAAKANEQILAEHNKQANNENVWRNVIKEQGPGKAADQEIEAKAVENSPIGKVKKAIKHSEAQDRGVGNADGKSDQHPNPVEQNVGENTEVRKAIEGKRDLEKKPKARDLKSV